MSSSRARYAFALFYAVLALSALGCVGGDPGGIAPLPSPADESLGGVDGAGVPEASERPGETGGGGGSDDSGGGGVQELDTAIQPDVRESGDDAAGPGATGDASLDGDAGSGSPPSAVDAGSADE